MRAKSKEAIAMSEEYGMHYAKYTIVFADVLKLRPTVLENIVMDTSEHTASIQAMLKSRYYNYEIAGETMGEFQEMLEMRFNQVKDYYIEMLEAYETKINMLDGRKTTREVIDTREVNGWSYNNNTQKGSSSSDSTYIDLPRSSSTEERPTNKTANTNNDNSNASNDSKYNTKDTNTRTATITGVDSQVELKEKYLKIIKNIWLEFADELKPCFLQLYY
jgi:hypothetical protein